MSQEIRIETLGRGVLAEQFDEELQRVLNNIQDPNTSATFTREINIKVKVKPSKDRNFCNITCQATSKLAAFEPAETTIFVDRDRKARKALGVELDHAGEQPDQHQLPNVTPIHQKEQNNE